MRLKEFTEWDQPFGGNARKVVAKFDVYKDKEVIRNQSKHLKGIPHYASEQFPKEEVDKGKQLYPKMKAAEMINRVDHLRYAMCRRETS